MVGHFAEVNEQEIRDLVDKITPKKPKNINSIFNCISSIQLYASQFTSKSRAHKHGVVCVMNLWKKFLEMKTIPYISHVSIMMKRIKAYCIIFVTNFLNNTCLEIWNLFLVLNRILHSFALLTLAIFWSTFKINFIFSHIHVSAIILYITMKVFNLSLPPKLIPDNNESFQFAMQSPKLISDNEYFQS